ncbi:hypothetical protein FHS39_001379 [Streptomyces olivoverticillatus]|uniref:Uncharacterized protein n=1 Tax=Streptomyces olivoverticillatus TaxID=66427 RepID=A0A7W7PKG3_9ACTN|nr:hypothetical protein [Streptomyces olivoverticillatus]MBB4892368.1 hypothetical protein [Streptomyces olivoverticillatus]
MAYLFIAHPPARRPNETRESIEKSMRDLGATLGLHPASQQMHYIGDRHVTASQARQHVK